MFEVATGPYRGLADAEAFIEGLRTLPGAGKPFSPAQGAGGRPGDPFDRERFDRGLFAPDRPLLVARAPGRLDVMGGIADYSGSLVLQWPLREATLAAAQRDPAGAVRIVSLAATGGPRVFETDLATLAPGGSPLAYEAARESFRERPETHWAAYVAGTLLVLMREGGAHLDGGLRLLVRSDVPEGKGVSSSAAVEVATMQAVAGAFGIATEPRELALLCQIVENRVAGAACGVMDQMTSACGREGALLALLCQPAEILGHVPVPPDIELLGLDSGERHAVSGSDYTAVRVGAFMGARILQETYGLPAGTGNGPLANVTPEKLEPVLQGIPEHMEGSLFLERYGGTTDAVTRVDPDRRYAVRTPTEHPIREHARVRAFQALLAEPPTDDNLRRLGDLMYASHASYTACGLGSAGTDRLVSLVRQAGPKRGFFGAKITGGGSGGTVAVLARRGVELGPVLETYEDETGHRPYVFRGSSPGAATFGLLRLEPR